VRLKSAFGARLETLRSALDTQPFDTLLVLIAENRHYISGYSAEDGQFDETAGVLLISGEKAILVTDSRYDLQASREAAGFEAIRYQKSLFVELPDILVSMGTRRLGFESVRMSCQQHQELATEIEKKGIGIELVSSRDLIENQRICKDPVEVDAIRRALSLTESVFVDFFKTISAGATEKALAWELEKRLRQAGADALSFPTIVAGGPNSALPHAVPTDRPVRQGEPILFDFGIRLNGYCSDISRMVYIGEPDETYRNIYAVVLEAQQKAIQAIQPGERTIRIDAEARGHIAAMGFGDNFGHGLGHGVGLAIHEAPRLNPQKDTKLAPGMITTVEPGIYIADWGGIRLENMVAVTETGAEVLNKTDPTEMIIL
jgi:Xaa-Pro aminopeptidase